MKKLLSRGCAAAIAAVVATGGLAATADADPVESGTLTFSGDPGDFVTGGDSYTYDVAAGDDFSVTSIDNESVSLFVTGGDGVLWSVDFDAPEGETLTAGTTYTATRYPYNGDGAGLDFGGDHRGCNQLTGSFTVHEAVFGPYGYVETFDASFEQHCEGATPAARGEVRLTNPTPAPALSITAGAETGTVTGIGDVVLDGTVTCTLPTPMFLFGRVSQDPFLRGQFQTTVDCTPGAPVPWSVTVTSDYGDPYHVGPAELFLYVSAYDANYDRSVVRESTTDVTLVG